MSEVDQNPRDINAIEQLKARYFRYMDTKRWTDLRSLFTDDARFEGTNKPFSGADEFVSRTAARLQPAVTIHQGHMPEIVLTSATTARGIWAMFDWVEFDTPIPEGRGKGYRGFTGYGHYEEEYRKGVDGQWRISFLSHSRIRMNPVVGAPQVMLDGWLATSKTDWLTGKPFSQG